jgi:hypothetical protein
VHKNDNSTLHNFSVIALCYFSNLIFIQSITQKVYEMCSSAPGYFRVDTFSILRVIALDLVKISNFQLVSHVTQKVFDLES